MNRSWSCWPTTSWSAPSNRGRRLRGRPGRREHLARPGGRARAPAPSRRPGLRRGGAASPIDEKPEQSGLELLRHRHLLLRRRGVRRHFHLGPSGRGELEITDVNNHYIGGQMAYDVLEGFWGDAGESIDAYYAVNDFVRANGANSRARLASPRPSRRLVGGGVRPQGRRCGPDGWSRRCPAPSETTGCAGCRPPSPAPGTGVGRRGPGEAGSGQARPTSARAAMASSRNDPAPPWRTPSSAVTTRRWRMASFEHEDIGRAKWRGASHTVASITLRGQLVGGAPGRLRPSCPRRASRPIRRRPAAGPALPRPRPTSSGSTCRGVVLGIRMVDGPGQFERSAAA